jgi:hypothetical protein
LQYIKLKNAQDDRQRIDESDSKLQMKKQAIYTFFKMPYYLFPSPAVLSISLPKKSIKKGDGLQQHATRTVLERPEGGHGWSNS